MNDQFKNDTNGDEIGRKLNQVVERINLDPHFSAELEERLRYAHRPPKNWFAASFRRVSPTLRWAALMILLAVVLSWGIKNLIPAPRPASDITPMPSPPESIVVTNIVTLIPDNAGYEWRGTKLRLAAPLPESPAEANVYLWKHDRPASMDDARALAQRFRLTGEVGETPGEIPGNFDYLIVDGKQRLRLRADHYFTYHSNFENMTLGKPSEEQVRVVIEDFLGSHGFDFEYRLESAPQMQGQHFYVLPLTPDGHEMRFDYMMPLRYEVTMDDTGENIILSGYSFDYESLGAFGIITADEAFQKILNPNPQTGLMESFYDPSRGGGGGGSSFLQINLRGTPALSPSPTPIALLETPIIVYDPAFRMPVATIEAMDLVYYVRYPPYAIRDPNAGTQYLQPAWRFYGHYSDGSEFEILVQALKREFLLPELAPYTPPG